MITWTAEMLNRTRKPFGIRPAPEIQSPAEAQVRLRKNLPAAASNVPTPTSHPAKDELDVLRREHAKLQQAIYEAAQIQRKLCSPRELVWGEFEIAGEIFPVRHLSGDFFKVMELDSALGLIVGDIAGKGLSAGIWQAHVMDLIQRCARTHAHPAKVVAAVNSELCQDANEPPITALFFARIDPKGNELTYCNAGLPAPLLLRRDKPVEQLEEGGPMLGALRDATYKSATVRLNPGDTVLAYSDGLTESRNSRDEEFERTRLEEAASAVHGGNANQVLFSTLGAVLDFAETCSPADDLTLLVVRRREYAVAEEVSGHSKGFVGASPPTSSSAPLRKVERRGYRSK